jgi:PPIC-type PPIASE domain
MAHNRKVILSALATAVLLLAAGGCGGSEGIVVARVGGAEIREPDVAHWARAIEHGATLGGAPAQLDDGPRKRALEFLISSRWLMREAAALGVSRSKAAVERVLSERRVANGTDEFAKTLSETGQTVDDVRLEIATELAGAAIDRELASRAANVRRAEVDKYYERNRQQFAIPETRVVDLIEQLPSSAAASATLALVGGGPRFTRAGRRETLQRGRIATAGLLGKAAFVHAIFTARVGAVSPPMSLDHGWSAFVVRRIVPPVPVPLAAVRGEIVKRLVAERLRGLRGEFLSDYQAHWRARTSCTRGYVVPECRQYRGPLGAEVGGLQRAG